jgi:hypothetical protein
VAETVFVNVQPNGRSTSLKRSKGNKAYHGASIGIDSDQVRYPCR